MLRNTLQGYGWLARLFHWLLFFMFMASMIAGSVVSQLPKGQEKLELIGMHKSFGVLILMLVIARLLWKWSNPAPRPLVREHVKRQAARWLHALLYLLMLAQPLVGILMSQAKGFPVSFFGLFKLPILIGENESRAHTFHEMHEMIWIILATLVMFHIVAALHHHFVVKDRTLLRMITGK